MIHLLAVALMAAPVPAPIHYQLTYSRDNVREVRVEADFTLMDTVLYMVPYGAEHLPDGWRTFVRDERLRTSNGTAVTLTRRPDRRWHVAAPVGQRVRLSYTVAIEHDLKPWTPNAREAAYSRPWGVFAVGRALFIYNDSKATNIQVRVRAPEGWTASTAWQPAPAEPDTYVATSWSDAINSVVFVGDGVRFAVVEGPIVVTYVLAPSFAPSEPLLREATGRILRNYLDMFGGAPDTHILVVINPDSSVHGGGGGVFGRSISMTFDAPPTLAGIGGWGHTLAHEFFHVWNTTGLRSASEAEEWFREGFADYYAVLTMTRLGYFTGNVWTYKASQWLREGERAAGVYSLAEAGSHEWEPAGAALLYNGGATAALALDVALRRARPAGNGLDDAMLDLYRAIGNTTEPATNARVMRSVERAGHADASRFSARHVTGKEKIPVDDALAFLGLERTAAGIRLASSPDHAQQAARQTYFGPHSRLNVVASDPGGGAPVLITTYSFEATFTGSPVPFEMVVRPGSEGLTALLRSEAGDLTSARASIVEGVTTAEFEVHGVILKIEVRPTTRAGQITGRWERPGANGTFAGAVKLTHS